MAEMGRGLSREPAHRHGNVLPQGVPTAWACQWPLKWPGATLPAAGNRDAAASRRYSVDVGAAVFAVLGSV